MTTAAPPRPDVDELERRATDDPGKVCHLFGDHGVLCGHIGIGTGVFVEVAELTGVDPAASPCSCARARCASCAAEYTMRSAA